MSNIGKSVWYEVWVFWIFLASQIKISAGVDKYWLPNLEWETAENWIASRLPELDSHVVFPLDMRHAAGIGKSNELRLSGIDLARSGILVLNRNGNLQFSEVKNSRTKTSEWRRSGLLFWADPQNWNGSSKAAPHLEQVPCRQDDIILPSQKETYSVRLPMRDIEVRSIRTSDMRQRFNGWQWAALSGRREFGKGSFTVKYAEYSCDKCPCQEDPESYYLEEICSIQRPKCELVDCEFPLKVEGHCCPYCGGRVTVTNKVSLPMVRAAAEEALEGYAKRLAWHVRRTWDGKAEVLIKEKDDYSGIDILEAVADVKSSLLSMKIEVSSTETTGAALKGTRLAVTLVPLLVTPFVVLLLLFAGFLYFGYSYRNVLLGCREIFFSVRDGVCVDKSVSGKPFGFARFENVPEGNIQIANADDTNESIAAEEQVEVDSPPGGRFENPLYRSKRKHVEEIEVIDMEAPLSLAALRDKVEHQAEEVEMDLDE